MDEREKCVLYMLKYLECSKCLWPSFSCYCGTYVVVCYILIEGGCSGGGGEEEEEEEEEEESLDLYSCTLKVVPILNLFYVSCALLRYI